MLVLSRRCNESIHLPDFGINIQVAAISRQKVRLGVTAPRHIRVMRGEIVEQTSEGPAPTPALHLARNAMNSVGLGLYLAQEYLRSNSITEAMCALDRASMAFEEVQDNMASVASTPNVAHAPKGNALIVEDNVNEGQLLAECLQLYGYRSVVVGDGLAALDYLDSNDRPDVMLLDMNMPRLSGLETLEAIQADSRFDSLTIVAVSGAERESFPATGENRIQHWFKKPLAPSQLAKALNFSLRNPPTEASV